MDYCSNKSTFAVYNDEHKLWIKLTGLQITTGNNKTFWHGYSVLFSELAYFDINIFLGLPVRIANSNGKSKERASTRLSKWQW